MARLSVPQRGRSRAGLRWSPYRGGKGRRLIGVGLATVLLWSVASGACAVERPNILLILCDDLGWGDLGAFYQQQADPNKRLLTPELDRMAVDGMQLRAHYCPAPVCAPSRASLLTGVHQGHARVRDNQFDKPLEENHTLATVLRQAGYRTALIGKYGLQGTDGTAPPDWPGYPTRRGFDEFFGYVSHVAGHQHYPGNDWPLGDSPNHRARRDIWHNEQRLSTGWEGCYTTDLFTARAKDWVANQVTQANGQPFFLMLAYDTPHAALQVPSMPYPAGQGLRGGVQWIGMPGRMINTAHGDVDSFRHPDYVGRGWSDVEERFATMVRRVDECVGDLLQTLRELQIDDKTLVILTSDNGPHHESYLQGQRYDPTSFRSFGPWEGTKRDVWEGGIRVPTLVWWPGQIAAGQVDNQPSQFHDWMATFAEAAGVATPARCDGVSLLPTLLGKGERLASTIYIEYAQQGKTMPYPDFLPQHRNAIRGQMQVVMLDGYQGIRTDIRSADDPFAIFELSADPREANDLAASSDLFRQLEQRMRARVLHIRIPNETAPRPYDAAPIPAVAPPEHLAAGCRWRAWPGEFPWVPQTPPPVAGSSPQKGAVLEGTAETTQVGLGGPAAVEFTGWVRVEQTGQVTLTARSDQRFTIRLHDALLIDADYGYSPQTEKQIDVHLSAGYHPCRVNCLTDEQGRCAVQTQWSASTEHSDAIDPMVWFRPHAAASAGE